MKFLLNKITLTIILTLAILSSCSLFESKPTHYSGICEMLDDRISWYKDLKRIEDKYQVNMALILAFIKQESNFDAYARPPRKKLFDVIPMGRESSSYGYAQAKDKTWDWYQQKTGNRSHERDDFAHASEFIAWYVSQTHKMNNIAKTDVYNQYLAYHEGHNGFKNKSYNQKSWLIAVAKKVANTTNSYTKNLQTCRKQLDDTFGWSYF
jgi:hypothetical protein